MSKQLIQKLFLFGIERAGKSSIVNTLKGKPVENIKPTLAFSLVNFEVDEFKFQIWDAPGQKKMRQIWNNGFNRAKFMIFVLDTSDQEKYIEANEEFVKVLSESDVQGIPLIFCFHKIDIEDSKNNLEKAKEVFNLSNIEDREVRILETSIFDESSMEELKNSMVEYAEKIKAYRY